jgi:uncharacterized membrane protein
MIPDVMNERGPRAPERRSEHGHPVRALARWIGSDRGGLAAGTLGWIGIGAGAAQLLAPHAVARWVGGGRPGLIRIGGAIEIAAALGLLRWRARARRVEVQRSITIGASPEVLYNSWRDPLVLAQILRPIGAVTGHSNGRLYWQAAGPLGRTLRWSTEFVEDRPNQLLRWSSGHSGSFGHQGSVRFRQERLELGTVVTLCLQLNGRIPGIVPGVLADKALRRFKSLIETAEIPNLDNNPAARHGAHAKKELPCARCAGMA